MSITITIGWWFVPLLVTFAAFYFAGSRLDDGGGDYHFPVDIFIYGPLAIIVSIVAWLIWAVFT